MRTITRYQAVFFPFRIFRKKIGLGPRRFSECSLLSCNGTSLSNTSMWFVSAPNQLASVRRGIGGAATITYNCNGCQEQEVTWKVDGRNSEITRALHVAFIISGCMHLRNLQQLRSYATRFQDTIRFTVTSGQKNGGRNVHRTREAMKKEELGSWELESSDSCRWSMDDN